MSIYATTVTDKLQRVLNAAARVITDARKFDRGLGQILHDQLHWLDVPTGGSLQVCSDSSPVSERPRLTVVLISTHSQCESHSHGDL